MELSAGTQDFECQLVGGDSATDAAGNLTQGAADAFSADSASWQSCSAQPSFGELTDGDWAVAVRVGGPSFPEQLAFTAFTVDSQPPTIQARFGHPATVVRQSPRGRCLCHSCRAWNLLWQSADH